ncbi:MAG: hypothetical protein HY985_13240 [Magnetospirillum sp.]|nr:hypothetical protein [Magnetospirillum sp.]
MRKQPIEVGDRFVKIGTYQKAVWSVARIYQLPSEPPHAHLRMVDDRKESLTVSVPTLADAHFFRRA